MNWYKKAVVEAPFDEYPLAGEKVSGLSVSSNIPNIDSVSATLDDFEILDGIREVPMSDFNITGQSYSPSENKWIGKLEDAIKLSRSIEPLIVVVEKEGPYILEGSHRIDALFRLDVPSFPALVVRNNDELV